MRPRTSALPANKALRRTGYDRSASARQNNQKVADAAVAKAAAKEQPEAAGTPAAPGIVVPPGTVVTPGTVVQPQPMKTPPTPPAPKRRRGHG